MDAINITCVNCGCVLNEDTARLASPEWYQDTRYVHYCTKCQREQFIDIARTCGNAYLAFYICCAAYNIPFIPECVPEIGKICDDYSWMVYLNNLDQTEHAMTTEGEPADFSCGVTDADRLFGITKKAKMNPDVTSSVLNEGKIGTKRQRKEWGELNHYQKEDYDELDRLYEIQKHEYKDTGIDVNMEFHIREICKLRLMYNKQLAARQVKEAKATYDIISKMMADNLMRKRDETPDATIRLDTLISKMEQHGLAIGGRILPYQELLKVIQDDYAVYDMGKDVVDQILMAIYNTYRRNEGMPETDIMPKSLQVEAKRGEFRDKMTEKERKTILDIGVLPVLKKE